ncbi:MAG: hypothetical protein LBQ50_05245 [Planctomycetaceae bacterium]|jgi:hypothetical protein|nr:hypothetical protein [Planctomycetaceae bacterium]
MNPIIFTEYIVVSPIDGGKKVIKDKEWAIAAFEKGAIVIENLTIYTQLSQFLSSTTVHATQWVREEKDD